MYILIVLRTKILNFKSARPLLSSLFVREARALFRPRSLKLGALAYDRKDRQIFSDLSKYQLY
jgi:hypothetical protein